MEITVSRSAVAQEFGLARRTAERKSTIPILSFARLDADGDGLRIACTDGESSFLTRCDATVDKPGVALVPVKMLHDVAKNGEAAEVHLALNGKSVKVSCGAFSAKLQTVDPADFPHTPELPSSSALVPVPMFREAIRRVLFIAEAAASRNDSRFQKGALVEIADGRLIVVATDGYRVGVVRTLCPGTPGQRFRCAATATPAPNDHTELAQHASFLGVMNRDEMLVRWFINDSGDTKSWRLKGHAVSPFFDWMSSWARMAEHPRDLGDDLAGFDLPPLEITRHTADGPDVPITGGLFGGDVSATTLHDVKRQTIEARARVVADLVSSEPLEPWVIWCDTDYEADELLRVIPDAADVRGSHPVERKEHTLAGFADGTVRYLVTKPSVAGFGLNWQHCARVAFAGRSFSYESFYQAVRRCWRFGQVRSVQVHLIVAEGEDAIGRVIDRKADAHAALRAEMKAAMARALGRESSRRRAYQPTYTAQLPNWLQVSA